MTKSNNKIEVKTSNKSYLPYSQKDLFTNLLKEDKILNKNYQLFLKLTSNFDIFENNEIDSMLPIKKRVENILNPIDNQKFIFYLDKINSFDINSKEFKNNYFQNISFKSNDLDYLIENQNIYKNEGDFLNDESAFNNTDNISLESTTELVVNKVNL
ncbi:hypothetical protein [Mycoplasmopsis lipofaciens]|uniref:hypothetical protein n=1 Tax=Mycoplasmopsis lipofaciens TaxID=114884 RepID=UPI000488274E|nr:hypothetical protein [Mycoplasmopsis lipofaciens]